MTCITGKHCQLNFLFCNPAIMVTGYSNWQGNKNLQFKDRKIYSNIIYLEVFGVAEKPT